MYRVDRVSDWQFSNTIGASTAHNGDRVVKPKAKHRIWPARAAGNLLLLALLPFLISCNRVGAAVILPITPAATAMTVAPATRAAVTATPRPSATATVTATPTPTATSTPTDTPTPTATPTPTDTPTPTPDPAYFVNGVPMEHFVVMPPETRENVKRIFERGQELGRNPHAFSKVGDSISLTSHYFARFGQGLYDLGIYERLQPTIDYYKDSFERFGVATRIGLHAWIAFRPGLADPVMCEPEEHMVECEIRLNNPSILLIRLGTNDTAAGDAYERAIRHAIQYSIREGVIPVLVTKSDRFEGDNRHNETMRRLASEYAVPLWDFDVIAGTLPDRGLGGDSVHLTMYGRNDYTDPTTLTFGYPLSDLTGLMTLDVIRQVIAEVADQ